MSRGFRTQAIRYTGFPRSTMRYRSIRDPQSFYELHRGVSAGAAALGLPDDPHDASTVSGPNERWSMDFVL